MGRKRRRRSSEKMRQFNIRTSYHWPFEISIKIDPNRPRIAFLSGVPREYYPEDPGWSQLAHVFCPPIGETPECDYVPSDNRLNKPISTLGYGIGGLLGPRFAREWLMNTPAPNAYQGALLPAPVKRVAKAERKKWLDFVRGYEKVVQKQFDQFEIEERLKRPSGSRKVQEPTSAAGAAVPPALLQTRSQTDHPSKPEHPAKIQCRRRTAAFGMGVTNPRFRPTEKDDKPGVGVLLDPTVGSGKISYQITTPEGVLIPRVKLVCMPEGHDVCKNCKISLIETDYYQTHQMFKVYKAGQDEADRKFTLKHLALCRDCYSKALKVGCPPWSREAIPRSFTKARHCSCVHDHKDGNPYFVMKANCKNVLNLARKEIVYSRFFKDDPSKSRA